ncbi:MAG: transposase [Gammaproteobacteria bacterium]|nr:transposase [Gammaproteobacteria bacterium]
MGACHFDHTEGRHVVGQQVLTLGLVTEGLFMPLDSQIYMNGSKMQGLIRAFKDQCSTGVKRFDAAIDQSKPCVGKKTGHYFSEHRCRNKHDKDTKDIRIALGN